MQWTMEAASIQEVLKKRHYQCIVCSATRSKLSLIRAHMQDQHPLTSAEFCVVGNDRRRYNCPVCGVSRSKRSLLLKHMQTMHGQDVDMSEVNGDVSASRKTMKRKGYECNLCGFEVEKASHLQQHLLTHSEERPYLCPKDGCGKNYKRSDHLQRHLLQHQAYLCPKPGCIMICSNKSNLHRHLHNHDLKVNLQRGRVESKELLRCPEPGCEKFFEYPCRVQSHYEAEHGLQYLDFLCGEPGCGQHFDKALPLLEHIRNIHHTIVCPVCGKSVSRKSFGRHARTHEVSHVYQRLVCPFEGCKHSFANGSNLSVHIKVHHMGRRDYHCSYEKCERSFGYKHSRDNHEKTSLHCNLEGDFLEVDLKFQSRPRGGRKAVTLQRVEDLFRKRVTAL